MARSALLNRLSTPNHWHEYVDTAWASKELRQEFENETGFTPLPDSKRNLRSTIENGYYDKYFDAFSVWITLRLNIVGMAPTPIQEAILN